MIGLKRGTVKLIAHQNEWDKEAKRTIEKLKHFLGNTAIDIQHIGSTAISSIHSKPIIDIAIGVYDLIDIMPYIDVLGKNGFIFRGEDVSKQVYFETKPSG
ncbi:MAG: GrpB family protein [Lachnospiraceae bacterium]|nr:GrpB family protein [Lachnospiraceae bacterium]